MMFWTYFQFLSINVLKKWTTWVFGALFLFIISMLLIVAPLAAGISPWSMWGSPIMSPTIMMMYVAALYSAINSIAIFKDYRDDGTELILSSKPLSRSKMALAKFTLYILSSLLVSTSTVIVSLLTFCIPHVTSDQVPSLILSLFVSSFLIMVIMGMIATIVSLFANKIWTVLGNIALVILIEIISVVNIFAVKTPADLAKKDGHTVISVNYLNENGKNNSFGALTPIIDTTSGLNLDFLTLQDEQAEWTKYTNHSFGSVANAFDFTGQFTILNNFGALDKLANENASKYFGENRFYDYALKNKHIWESDNQPLFYVQLPNVPIELTDTFDLTVDMPNFMNKIIQSLSGQSMIVIGNMNASAFSIQNLMTTITQNEFPVAWCYDGWVGSPLGKKWLTYDKLWPNADQSLVFQKILDTFLDCTKDLDDDKIYDFGSQLEKVFSGENSGNVSLSKYSLKNTFDNYGDFIKNLLGEDEDVSLGSTNNFRNLLHYIFVKQNDPDFPDFNITDNENILKNIFWQKGTNDESGLMSTIASFKLYTFVTLTKALSKSMFFSSNTPLNLVSPNMESQQINIQLSASPILPLPWNNDESDPGYVNKNLDYDLPDEWKQLSLVIDLIALLKSYYPNVETIKLPNGEELDISGEAQIDDFFKWNIGDESSKGINNYYINRKIMRERALLNEITSENKYGYLDAKKADDFTLDQAYVTNLNTASVPSFPLLYNNLGAQFQASSNFTPWTLALGWAMFALLLCGCTYLIYSRTDFK